MPPRHGEPPRPGLALPAGRLVRIGRSSDPLRAAEIDPNDAALKGSGNRYDVVGAGVLYAATDTIGALKETLRSFRPSEGVRTLEDDSSGLMRIGSVPASWREKRVIVEFELSQPLPFLDVERDDTLSFLEVELEEELAELGYSALDSSHIRGADRLLTRMIASWAYQARDEHENLMFGGIRYSSRFQSHECWAIFSGNTFANTSERAIQLEDPDVQSVAQTFRLTLH